MDIEHQASTGAPVAAPPAAAAVPSRERSGLRLLGVLLLPLRWLGRVFAFRYREAQGTQVLAFTSFNSLIYAWPVAAVGLLLHLAWWTGIGGAETLGWIWLTVIIFTLILLGTDINRTAMLVWFLGIGLVLALGALLNAYYHIPLLGYIYRHFDRLEVRFDPGTSAALSELVLLMLAVVVVHALLDGSHEISSREITHRRFLRANESWPLGLNRVKLDWPDLMEMIVLFGAGHMVIIDQDRKEVLRIPNIPFLWFFRRDVERVLEIMATTEVDLRSAPT